MPRIAKKDSTYTDIVEAMYNELCKSPDSRDYHYAQFNTFNLIPEYEYNELIGEYLISVAYDDTTLVHKDLSKINFDFENCTEMAGDIPTEQLPDGTAIFWCAAGGDWEVPLYFVVYLCDKNQVRAYIPTKGNTFCTHCKTAFGSCGCDKPTLSTGEEIDDDYDINEIEPDNDLMYEDVCNRIITK